MWIERDSLKVIGMLVCMIYGVFSVFCAVSYQFFKVAQIPPFLGSLENLYFVVASGFLLSSMSKRESGISAVLGLVMGVLLLTGSSLFLSDGRIAAILPIAVSVLLIPKK